MGGEKVAVSLCMVLQLGSPPHGRGKGNQLVVSAVLVGITPADAGKSR